MPKKYYRFLYQPCRPLGKDGRCATASPEHIALSRRAAGEGMVLLENRNRALPLNHGEKIALFGKGSVDYIKGGGGSGDVYTPYVRNIADGMTEKESEGKVEIFKPLCDFYREHVKKQRAWIEAESPFEYNFVNVSIPRENAVARDHERAKLNFKYQVSEPEIPDELFDSAKAFARTAVITISRFSSEGWDRSSRRDLPDFYLTEVEQNLVNRVADAFEKVIIVLNIGGMIDSEWFIHNPKISAVLLAWQGGMEGGSAVADILVGDVNPSGKLTDTFARTFEDYPSSATFNESYEYIDYLEDIYVGYRYFETIPGAAEKVSYPFGHGLSYTTFDISGISAHDDGTYITVAASVTNTGDTDGKEVVQVYYSAPQGVLGKPAKELAAFHKTALLKPGQTETFAMRFRISDMASYDDLGKLQKSAYVLEQGDYSVWVGNSVRNLKKTDYIYSVREPFRVTEQCTEYCKPCGIKKRMLSDGSFEALDTTPQDIKTPEAKPNTAKAPSETVPFDQVGEKITLDEFMAQLTDEELISLLGGKGDIGVANTGCMAGLKKYGIPFIPTADGPAGVRLFRDCGIPTTAWPCATLVACTWNTELAEEIGAAGAREARENNIGVWLTPAVNIHRSPLCGRNFEYYSEDPLVTGKMAAASVRGIQSQKVAASVKAICCNNKEVNRLFSDSRLSERALREIYLKGDEICVREAQPWTVMTSYNRMNGIFTSENYGLLTGIMRNEWGYDGMVTTDWGNYSSHVKEVKAGNDIRMWAGNPEELRKALADGTLTRADMEVCVRRILQMVMKLD